MHIAVYHNLPSGGAKRTLYEQTIRLVKNHDVHVYTLSSADHGYADIHQIVAKYKIYNFDPLPLFNSPFGRFNQIMRTFDLFRLRRKSKYIANDIKNKNYDIIFIHPCQFENSPSVMQNLGDVPTVYYCHESLRKIYEKSIQRPYIDSSLSRRKVLDKVDPLPRIYQSVLKKLDFQNMRSAKTVLVNSQFTKQQVELNYQRNANVCYHGVNTELFRPLSIPKRDILLSIGSLTPRKGFDFIIRSLALIPANNRPALEIASNFQVEEERDFLEELARSLGVNMKFHDQISDTRLVELYNQAMMVVYTPHLEPFGLVPLESMACETPVVGIREGGIVESIIDGRTGLLVDRDPEQLSNAIQNLVSNSDMRTELGRKGREHVLKDWTWEASLNQLEDYLSLNTSR